MRRRYVRNLTYCVMSKKKGEKYPGNRCDSEGGEYQVERDRMKGKKPG